MPALAIAASDLTSFDQTSFKENSIIVVYKEGTSALERRNARDLVLGKISDINADEVDDKYLQILNGRMANIEIGKSLSTKQALAKLKDHPAVLYAEPDYIVKTAVTPDDTRYDELWGMHNTGQTGGTADADIDAPEAWEISTGDRDIIVGVIDSGVDHSHPDLAANMWTNPGEIPNDGIDNDNNGYIDDMHGINAINDSGDPMDDNGHGTHVAGTIGATGNNSLGVVGVNHEVSIIGCKFLSAGGSGSTSDAIQCIDYFVGLANAGVNVKLTNNSWGGGGFSQALSDAIQASEDAGMLFVAASGNGGYDNDASPSYPSSYEHDSIIAVANTNHNDGMSGTSQWGLTSVDLGAPGSAILSTIPGGGYDSYSGTSMASPHVAGAAALVMSVNASLTPQEVKDILLNSGDDNAALAGKTVSGKRLNANQALIDADPTPGFKMSVSPSTQEIIAGDTATYNFNMSSIAEWTGTIALTLTDTLGGAVLSQTSVSETDAFTLSVPTEAETAWGSYSFTVTATSGGLVKEKVVSLDVKPQGLNDFTYENTDSVAIPDNDANGVSSVINIADNLTIFDTSTFIDITHTWIGDLVVTLTSPQGTTATLVNRSGGSADDIQASFPSSAFNGETTMGDWTLNVSDNVGADTGNLNNWSITFTALGDVAPAAPSAGFAFEVDLLQVNFTDQTTDVNGDVVSWAWDFGDGNTSTTQNPVHTYASAGTYSVSLTATDAEGLSSTSTQNVTVDTSNITAAIKRAYKSRLGNLRVDITWEGTNAENVDIYRNGTLLETVANTGIYRDRERRTTGSSFTYQVCVGTTCSDEVTASF